MRGSILSAALAAVAGVSAYPQEMPNSKPDVQPLPIEAFIETPKFVTPVPLEDAKAKLREVQGNSSTDAQTNEPTFRTAATEFVAAATCSNVQVRTEWDSLSDSQRQAYIDAIKCLMGRAPNGQFPQSKSRYEDLVALHQTLTPNVHGNAKFLIWHRYLLWTFNDVLRAECGYNQPIPWFDETRYAGNFQASSIFSSQWYGSVNIGGNCVSNGQFANLAINVGPGTGNQLHCLARNGDDSKTANCNQDYVNQCNAWGDYANMGSCSEGGPHAWGHNGIGAVMQDVYASPADPVFWLHHGFVDRSFRIWQNQNSGVRTTSINGNDAAGNALTLDTTVNVYGIRPDQRIRDLLDTTGTTLCYKYNY